MKQDRIMYRKLGKRTLDILLSLVILPLLGLAILIFGPAIWLEDRGTIFYKAKRRGLHGKIFEMYKFRTMKMNAPDIRNLDNSTYNSPVDPRITKVGRILRKTSIDELPQFINVLKGDMSTVGPRPITIDKPLSDYDSKRRIRLLTRPGITGYSQAYYRNSISQEEKFEADADYAYNMSLCLDMKIFFKTIETVLQRKNVYRNGQNE